MSLNTMLLKLLLQKEWKYNNFPSSPDKVQIRRACGHLGVDMALGEVLLLAGRGGDHVQLDGLLLSSHGIGWLS